MIYIHTSSQIQPIDLYVTAEVNNPDIMNNNRSLIACRNYTFNTGYYSQLST
jgi:hypothetical protein